MLFSGIANRLCRRPCPSAEVLLADCFWRIVKAYPQDFDLIKSWIYQAPIVCGFRDSQVPGLWSLTAQAAVP